MKRIRCPDCKGRGFYDLESVVRLNGQRAFASVTCQRCAGMGTFKPSRKGPTPRANKKETGR